MCGIILREMGKNVRRDNPIKAYKIMVNQVLIYKCESWVMRAKIGNSYNQKKLTPYEEIKDAH
jgi:hypothetical protein